MKISDVEGVQKLEYELNGTLYSTDPDNTGTSINLKEFEFKQELTSGANKLVIRVYNISWLMTETTFEQTI